MPCFMRERPRKSDGLVHAQILPPERRLNLGTFHHLLPRADMSSSHVTVRPFMRLPVGPEQFVCEEVKLEADLVRGGKVLREEGIYHS